jgi:hypothetical protein
MLGQGRRVSKRRTFGCSRNGAKSNVPKGGGNQDPQMQSGHAYPLCSMT